jgi:hypothetical protein
LIADIKQAIKSVRWMTPNFFQQKKH